MLEEKEIKQNREIIKLDSDILKDLVFEEYLNINGKEIEIEIVENKYESTGRHQEYHSLVFKRLSDNKFFRVQYSTSVKDTMDWEECNYGPFKANEVFPKTISQTIYE
jgi:translation elongation factor P/translation initiation factor 5A